MGVVEDRPAELPVEVAVHDLVAASRDKVPADIASGAAQDERLRFLRASLGDSEDTQAAFERILLGNELQPVNYLQRGAIAAQAIARIAVRSALGNGWGTGFLISPQVLITNNHVFPDRATAASSLAHFGYEIDLADRGTDPVVFRLEPHRLFHTSKDLDFTVVAVHPQSIDDTMSLENYGCLPLLGVAGKAFEGEWLTIIQHPNGEPKQICVRENKLLSREENILIYSTDTMPGTSGAPVFNNDWFVVALHYTGVPEQRNGVWQTVDGRDYDPRTMDETQVKWIANAGIRASRIVQTLKTALPDHPLLLPMYSATPESARITAPFCNPAAPPRAAHHSSPSPNPTQPERQIMSDVRTVTIPIEIKLNITSNGHIASAGGGSEAAMSVEAKTAKTAKRPAKFDAPFDADYSTRGGYAEDFLNAPKAKPQESVVIPLPQISGALLHNIARLVSAKDPKSSNPDDYIVKYHNYSVAVHAKRRMSIFSAANINFGNRYEMSRPTDVWRLDPRIKAEHQLENWYYQRNQFDRGHLTRREDLEYGDTALEALASAADTCHWLNCVPQHSKFNQNKETWQGLERYLLEDSIAADRAPMATVITGPVLDEGDPEYNDIQYPVQFWKVVAALDADGALFATAYIASQEAAIAEHGIEAAMFGDYNNYQTTISEIERLTGLSFPCKVAGNDSWLRDHDPLVKKPRRRRRAGAGGQEAAFGTSSGTYWLLQDVDDVQT
jgi:endonuclease G